ncbi:hypothetical protein [Levilactobacillus brevis]|uniref:hypothetical protein n=1 Tax=Levilactobacillus brevis TaxID=1580 RepID=UPI00131EFDF2|nr:hypothetical protein [Levilactobacillus brevis]MBX6948915.1 hypothetical protein [Levilactobacillus brevis]
MFRTIFELRQAYRLGVNLSNPKIKKDLLLIDLVIISEIIIGDRLARAVLDVVDNDHKSYTGFPDLIINSY